MLLVICNADGSRLITPMHVLDDQAEMPAVERREPHTAATFWETVYTILPMLDVERVTQSADSLPACFSFRPHKLESSCGSIRCGTVDYLVPLECSLVSNVASEMLIVPILT